MVDAETLDALPAPARAGLDGAARARRRRLFIGVTLLAVALGADVLMQWLFASPTFRAPGRLLSLGVRFVAVVFVCMAVNAWSERRGHGAAGRIVRAVLAAGAVGAAITLLELRLFPITLPSTFGPIKPQVFALFGFTRGVVVCGLWALGFVYPLAVEAERARIDAELARLRGHLEPHFLLNTLNLIAGLVGQDPDEARRLIGCLGELLADAVDGGDDDASLSEDLAWLRRYTDILQARHPDLLHFTFDISAAARGRTLPRLLLQPLVENAVKHGVLGKPGGGTVTVRAHVDDANALVCIVHDDGRGLSSRPVRAGAFGVESVRRRLSLERPGATFSLRPASEGGTEAIVRIPAVRK